MACQTSERHALHVAKQRGQNRAGHGRIKWPTAALALSAVCLSAALAFAQGPPERTFVLVVGVEDYTDPKITDLTYAEDDAQAV